MFKLPHLVKMILPLELIFFFKVIIGVFLDLDQISQHTTESMYILYVSIIGRSITLIFIIYRIYAFVVLKIEASKDEINKMHIHDKELKIEKIMAPAKKFKKRYLIGTVVGYGISLFYKALEIIQLKKYPKEEASSP